MRCPKCGYISFDHSETCKKCSKNIADANAEVNGTVCDIQAPSFLKSALEEQEQAEDWREPDEQPQSSSWMDDVPLAETAEEEEDTEQLQEIEMKYALDEEEADTFAEIQEMPLHDVEEDIPLDFDEFQEPSFAGGQADTTGDGEETDQVSLDFNDLDISDLAPPKKEPLEKSAASASPEEARKAASQPAVDAVQTKRKDTSSSELEDLQIDDLDLETPAKLIPGSAAGKRYLPSVKTGTALDKFEIDLGDLFAEETARTPRA